jgi:hypothetical protein
MYHDRTAWRCAFFVGKNMEAKDIHNEMLPIWATDLSVLWVAYATHSTLKPVTSLPP